MAGTYFPWFYSPWAVLAPKNDASVTRLDRVEKEISQRQVDAPPKEKETSPTQVAAPPKEKETSPRQVAASKNLIWPSAKFAPRVNQPPTASGPTAFMGLHPPEPVRRGDSRQAVKQTVQSVWAAHADMTKRFSSLQQSSRNLKIEQGQFATHLVRFIRIMYSVFFLSPRHDVHAEFRPFSGLTIDKGSQSRLREMCMLVNVVKKLTLILLPPDEETMKHIVSLFSPGNHADVQLETAVAMRDKVLGLVLFVLNIIDFLVPNSSHSYSGRTKGVTQQPDLICQLPLAMARAWDPETITVEQKATIDQLRLLITSLNGQERSIRRWLIFGKLLEYRPEYAQIITVLEIQPNSSEAGMRAMDQSALVCAAESYSSRYFAMPSTHPRGVAQSAQQVAANNSAWRVAAIGLAVSGERSNFTQHADGDGALVFLARLIGTKDGIDHLREHLGIEESTVGDNGLLDEKEIVHLRLTGVDALETTGRNAKALAVRDTLMAQLRASRVRARTQMQEAGVKYIPAIPGGDPFNNYEFSAFQIRCCKATHQGPSPLEWIPGTANLVVFFLYTYYNSGESFDRMAVLLADATLDTRFNSRAFMREFETQHHRTVATIPPWVFPTLFQTTMIEAHSYDHSVQLSDNHLPITRVSLARAHSLLKHTPSPNWKFRENEVNLMLTSQNKVRSTTVLDGEADL